MKPGIGKDYASLCSQQSPLTDYLFGDDLRKQLKDISDVNKIQCTVSFYSVFFVFVQCTVSFSHKRPSKNFKGQTHQPQWWHEELHKKNQTTSVSHSSPGICI